MQRIKRMTIVIGVTVMVGDDIKQNIYEIKEEIRKLKHLMYSDFLNKLEKSVETGVGQILISIISAMNSEIIKDKAPTSCSRYEECISTFSKLLDEALKKSIISEELRALYEEKKMMLDSFKKGAPYERCSSCFSEALELLEKQTKIMSSFKETVKNSLHPTTVHRDTTPHEMVKRLEPISNTIRIQILLELLKGPKRFNQLSKITMVDGGNLRFHIKKLIDAGLVVQYKRGGEYMITEHGKIFFERFLVLLQAI